MGEERQQAADFIRSIVRKATQLEVADMDKTNRQCVWKEEALLEANRKMLLRQLRLKFKNVPGGHRSRNPGPLWTASNWTSGAMLSPLPRSIRKMPFAANK